ncbi:MAG: efflux RND transporter periplasmic adaptor subunit [Gammaproteobacteria bacterium]|nr:efflux RND transporter periplasmic adaptor subunit [Gammaproteobacteria bacterium]
MKLRMFLMLLVTALVFGAVFGMKWMGAKAMNRYFDAMPVPPATISTAAVAPMSWDNSLEAPGSFVAVNGTEVTTESGGIVQAIHFESGDIVDAGERLVTLDASTEVGELKRLQAQAELAELNRDRRAKLLESHVVSKSDYDAALAELAAARAAVEAQAAKVAKKDLRAPFAGVLGIRHVNLGQYLAPGTAIVTLQSLDPIDIDFALPEMHLSVVRPGLAITVAVDAYPGRTFGGRILAIEPRIDAATRNFIVRGRLANKDRRLRAGMFGRLRLDLPGKTEVLAVPRTAISYSSYGSSVFLVQPRKAPAEAAKPEAAPAPAAGQPAAPQMEVVQRFVKVGEIRGDFVAILEGVMAGEQVATSGLLKLRNQQPVIVNNEVMPQVELNPNPGEG